MTPPAPKRVSESSVSMSEFMLPSDANPSGNVHGGSILKLVDLGGGGRHAHCRTRVVTARLDEMSFLRPVYIGNLVTLKASVNDTGRTSLEVGVRVEAEDLATGETWHVGSAYLVFVALDADGKPVPVPPLLPESETEQRRQLEARRRRASALSGTLRRLRRLGGASGGDEAPVHVEHLPGDEGGGVRGQVDGRPGQVVRGPPAPHRGAPHDPAGLRRVVVQGPGEGGQDPARGDGVDPRAAEAHSTPSVLVKLTDGPPWWRRRPSAGGGRSWW